MLSIQGAPLSSFSPMMHEIDNLMIGLAVSIADTTSISVSTARLAGFRARGGHIRESGAESAAEAPL